MTNLAYEGKSKGLFKMRGKSNSIIKCLPFSPTFIYVYTHTHTRLHAYSHKATPFSLSSLLFFCSSHSGNLFHIVCESVLSHCRHMASLASEIEFWLRLSYLATSGTITVSKEMGCTQASLGLTCIFMP